MKKNDIAQAIKNRQVRDYTYAIMFFFVSSFFAFFVIKPVLSIAIQIRREGDDLKRINKIYEDNITSMLQLQSQLETLHNRKGLITDALPSSPDVSRVIQDLQRAGVDADVPITSIEVGNITYKSEKGKPDSPTVQARMQAVGGFDKIDALLREIMNQRRIKTVRTLTMTALKGGENTSVNLIVELDARYLEQSEK